MAVENTNFQTMKITVIFQEILYKTTRDVALIAVT